jgi:hypothetical protein
MRASITSMVRFRMFSSLLLIESPVGLISSQWSPVTATPASSAAARAAAICALPRRWGSSDSV